MSKVPGEYIDIGKKARDLLHKNYANLRPTHFRYQSIEWNFDFSCQIGEIVPGLKAVFRLLIPVSSKAELRYSHDYIGVTAGIGLKANSSRGIDPIVNFSGVLGNTVFSLGTDIGFDMPTRAVNKFNIGLSFDTDFLAASLSLNDKFENIEAAFYHTFNPATRTSIAAELKHSFSINGTTLTLGAQHALFPFTLVKARASTDGKINALVQQEFWQKFFIAISGEVDFRAAKKTPKLGLSMALWP